MGWTLPFSYHSIKPSLEYFTPGWRKPPWNPNEELIKDSWQTCRGVKRAQPKLRWNFRLEWKCLLCGRTKIPFGCLGLSGYLWGRDNPGPLPGPFHSILYWMGLGEPRIMEGIPVLGRGGTGWALSPFQPKPFQIWWSHGIQPKGCWCWALLGSQTPSLPQLSSPSLPSPFNSSREMMLENQGRALGNHFPVQCKACCAALHRCSSIPVALRGEPGILSWS